VDINQNKYEKRVEIRVLTYTHTLTHTQYIGNK